jgi:hypothetical protein
MPENRKGHNRRAAPGASRLLQQELESEFVTLVVAEAAAGEVDEPDEQAPRLLTEQRSGDGSRKTANGRANQERSDRCGWSYLRNRHRYDGCRTHFTPSGPVEDYSPCRHAAPP